MEDIEQYLLEKINHAIEKQQSSEHLNLLGQLARLEPEFQAVRNDLEKATSASQFTARRENLYYLNNLLAEWQMIFKKHSSYSLVESYEAYQNIKKGLKKIKKHLKGEDPTEKGSSHPQEEEPKRPVFERNKKLTFRWSSRHGPRKVHGLEDKAMSMEREIVLGNVCAIGVVGVVGIGKTTLCQAVFDRQRVKESFFPRIWVCLSKQPGEDDDNRKEIVVRILKACGVEDDVIVASSFEVRRLIFLLRMQLTRKRYLIVLDDAWNGNKFFQNLTKREHLDENWGEELAYGLPKGFGGTVILSSRSGALAKKMIGEDASFQYMKPISDENCGEIFKDTVVGYDDDRRELPPHLKDLKGEVINKCAGLPLAAKLLGRIAKQNLPVEKEKPPVTVSSGGGGTGGGQKDKHDEIRAGEVKRGEDNAGEEDHDY